MKPSEALVLGSTLLKPAPGHVFIEGSAVHGIPDSGCALGMIIAGMYGVERLRRCNMDSTLPVWMLNTQVRLPCECGAYRLANMGFYAPTSVASAVIHLFDHHYGSEWSIDRIADWLRSIEPAEDAPESEPKPAESRPTVKFFSGGLVSAVSNAAALETYILTI